MLTLPRLNQRWKARKEVRDSATFHPPNIEWMLNVVVFFLPQMFTSKLTYFFTPSLSSSSASHLEQLMKAEEKGSGAVAWSVYGAYIKAAGGALVFTINIFFFLSTTGSIAFSNWWLSHWIRQGSGVSLELYYNRRLPLVCLAPKRKITTMLQWIVAAEWALIWMCMIKKVTAPR